MIGLVVVLLWDLAVKRKSVVVFMSLAGVSLLVAIFFLVEQWVVLDSAAPEAIFSEMLLPDRRSVFFRILFCVGGLLTLLLSIRYRSGSLRVGFRARGQDRRILRRYSGAAHRSLADEYGRASISNLRCTGNGVAVFVRTH